MYIILQRRLDEMSGETFDDSCIGMQRFYFSSRVLGIIFVSIPHQGKTINRAGIPVYIEGNVGGLQIKRLIMVYDDLNVLLNLVC